MKNLLGMLQGQEKIDGSEFIVKEISEDLAERQRIAGEKLASFEKQANLPLWMYLIKIISIAIATIITVASIAIAVQKGFDNFFKQSGWAVIVAVCLWLIFFTMIFIQRVRQRETLEDTDWQAEIMRVENLYQECKKYLEIPENAQDITVFGALYKQKGEKQVNCLPMANYVALEFFVYANQNEIFLADTCMVLKIERSKILSYQFTQEKLTFHGWTKNESYLSPTYKPYKIYADNYGVFHLKGAFKVLIKGENQEYELVIPVYDGEKINKILN